MFIMKKSIVLFAMLSAVSGAAFAQTSGAGEVKFDGQVIDGACSITDGERIKPVHLGSISKNNFKALGDRSQMQAFSLTLSECTWDDQAAERPKVSVKFTNTLGDGTSKVVLNHPSATAKDVGIRIFNGDGSVLDMGTASTAYSVSDRKVVLPFFAAVEATAATVTPGTIDATAKYVLTYN